MQVKICVDFSLGLSDETLSIFHVLSSECKQMNINFGEKCEMILTKKNYKDDGCLVTRNCPGVQLQNYFLKK
ncbi:hypothetical protein BpHYR1_054604 [Brachionus plicatilis]|uniref:Uncharacterized protein n=1 Tax=Brachionus plicatilis TaxID=10195 RepID=A0A3M7RFI9_BRAPC|nr:hypothetical protein BpHYR1_054604 [Brachionus plicatilis]